ncbi:hypothetical protein SERLADRAFT_411755 [Serpula lacrymans var. lacrymans S7.9]|uniref:Carboxylesterase type B domain-containing protein n=1 Tax=Serpula lacrymans var. lacrymans (strain S7.9) TaxID=578457 RepID=F8PC46_SERL9|nr:uncharacterized protein SERLADRAFT_411755 [Serpula lacrymans var. lacrymans S7.9]EGO19246.1 hypothetical protein SERLADRAFT_411755 [Serpula lacrymans var. lacrymans S7.9]
MEWWKILSAAVADKIFHVLLYVITATTLSPPSVKLDHAIFTGTTNGSVSAFLGIPYTQPPGTYDASVYGLICPQQTTRIPFGNLTAETEAILASVLLNASPQSEDCLTINVYKPANATPSSKLPVVVFKRVAAFLGDINFQGPRRFLLQARSGHQKTWSFLSKRMKDTPGLGAFHGSDIDIIYGSADMTDYLIRSFRGKP